ncbi:uncharacterized protein LOC131161826 [Malania oleifera]|uniref:uncharacterized protein LOC131161826 n=1 Tax=Malania oleifera TaxID=397392 RepID=UPI0025AEC310|nr:uncharacterized protein LOC131161826 [Malania oleifera]
MAAAATEEVAVLVDDSTFKKPGTVPFKWEIRPGVPKFHQNLQQPPAPPLPKKQQQQQHHHRHHHHGQQQPQKLRPPPAGLTHFHPPPEVRTRSFRSVPRGRSDRWRFTKHDNVARPEVVSQGCFLGPLLTGRKDEKKRAVHNAEPDFTLQLETLARWSVSSRKSLSPFRNSPSSSYSSSYQSSPRPVSDAEWAGFGLF